MRFKFCRSYIFFTGSAVKRDYDKKFSSASEFMEAKKLAIE